MPAAVSVLRLPLLCFPQEESRAQEDSEHRECRDKGAESTSTDVLGEDKTQESRELTGINCFVVIYSTINKAHCSSQESCVWVLHPHFPTVCHRRL